MNDIFSLKFYYRTQLVHLFWEESWGHWKYSINNGQAEGVECKLQEAYDSAIQTVDDSADIIESDILLNDTEF